MAEVEGVDLLAYLILEVTYRRGVSYGQSLAWIAPELKDAAGLEMTEDLLELDCAQCGASCHNNEAVYHHQDADDEEGIDREADADHTPTFDDDLFPSRKWAGTITRPQWDALRSAWSLTPEASEPNLGMLTGFGKLPAYAFMFDGMDWNMGGLTPIEYASLYINVPAAWWEEVPS